MTTNPEPIARRKRLPRERPAWVSDDAIFFITVCCEPRDANQLCVAATADAIFESVAFRQQRGDWFVYLLLLMPDHLHLLAAFPPRSRMASTIVQWKGYVAKILGVKWQRDFFEHRLRGSESFREKAQYIRMNPVRKGLCAETEPWPYVWERDALGRAGGPALPATGGTEP